MVGLFTFLLLVMMGSQFALANDEEDDGIVCEQEGEHEGENEGCDNDPLNNEAALVNGGIGLLVLTIIGAITFYLYEKKKKAR